MSALTYSTHRHTNTQMNGNIVFIIKHNYTGHCITFIGLHWEVSSWMGNANLIVRFVHLNNTQCFSCAWGFIPVPLRVDECGTLENHTGWPFDGKFVESSTRPHRNSLETLAATTHFLFREGSFNRGQGHRGARVRDGRCCLSSSEDAPIREVPRELT